MLEVDPAKTSSSNAASASGARRNTSATPTSGRTFVVHEGGLKFQVNLSDYVDTGLFLDHRITRSMVRDAADGKRFLNLFGYTGAFTVYAAAGGAASTTTRRSVEHLSRLGPTQNMALNGFDGPGAPVRPRRRAWTSCEPAAERAVRPGRGRPADVLQQQANRGRSGTCSATTSALLEPAA